MLDIDVKKLVDEAADVLVPKVTASVAQLLAMAADDLDKYEVVIQLRKRTDAAV